MDGDNKQIISDLLMEMFNDILRVEHKVIESDDLMPLSMSELHIIEAVGNDDGNSIMSDIARKLHITLPTLTAAADRLEDKGYVQRSRSTTDRRRVSVVLTEEGKLAFERHAAFHKMMVDAFMSGLERTKQPELMDSMARLRDFFKEQLALVEAKANTPRF